MNGSLWPVSGKSLLDIRHNRHMAGSFYCYSKGSLMLCAISCDSSGKDFASFRNILSELCCILVVDFVILFSAEYAYFLSSAAASSFHGRVRSFTSVCICHGWFLLLERRFYTDKLLFELLIKRQFFIYAIRDIHKTIQTGGIHSL